jgi:endonuclease/exonuclease/phosphatase family metal-dependent hydrolase
MAGLRLMSYNVHTLRDDLGALAEVVAAAAPDVVVIQEAPRRLHWRVRCAELARRFGLVYAGGGLPSLGNLVLTNFRVRVHEHWCVRYPLTPGRHMRGAVLVRCEVGRTTFVVAGSHLATDKVERPAQAAILRATLAAVEEPKIVGVDMNDVAGSPAWRIVEDGLIDSGAANGEPTFPARAPTRRIDAVFVDPGCTIDAYQVFDHPRAVRASDHRPLLVDVTLPRADGRPRPGVDKAP